MRYYKNIEKARERLLAEGYTKHGICWKSENGVVTVYIRRNSNGYYLEFVH